MFRHPMQFHTVRAPTVYPSPLHASRRRGIKFPRVLFSFGVIADVQYANKENKTSRSRPESLMRYGNGVSKLSNAVREWSKRQQELSFVLNLGDIIDGNADLSSTFQDLEDILKPLDELNGSVDVHHVIGNHCLRVPVDVLMNRLGMSATYYSVEIHKGWRLIVLNSNDIGVHAEGERQKQETDAFLEKSPVGSEPQILQWNGGLASQQLQWLKQELALAKASGERVILACHHPIGTSSARITHMAWNFHQIESIVLESNAVALVMSGHDHVGGYSQIGITHFLTLPGVVEAPDEMDAYAVMHVTEDEIQIEGRGVIPSRSLALNYQT